MKKFSEMFDESALSTMAKQHRLAELIGEDDWNLDVQQALLSFSPSNISFDVQLLGTHSEVSNTWLWADANVGGDLLPVSLEMCRRARKAGRELGQTCFIDDKHVYIDQFGEPTADTLAMVSSHLVGADAYYRCPYEDGALYVAIQDARFRDTPDLDLKSFIEVYQRLQWLPGNTKHQLVAYANELGLPLLKAEHAAVAFTLRTGELVEFAFEYAPNGAVMITHVPH
jgi:hypothetical protein